jgi:DNA repair exonuclease SbcCD nuclease subunit
MLTILHGSDLHFGKRFKAEAAEAFLEAIRDSHPDLLVLSGDFTQRAKIREYEQARAYLHSLPDLPVVLTPGNHDVPLYRVWERLLTPLKNYREFISPELDSVTVLPGATVVSLNSTAPLRAIVNGRLRDSQLLFAAEAFEGANQGDLKVVVLHHHLAPAPDYESDQVLQGYQRCLAAFSKMGVELILGGHLHRSYVANSLDAYPHGAIAPGNRGMIIAHSGTTTSHRGRARERNKNSFNLIGITGDHISVTHYLLEGRGEGFVPIVSHTFPRTGRGSPRVDPILQDFEQPGGLSSSERGNP